MNDRKLFPSRRVCIACERSATPGRRREGEPNILAVSMTITRKGFGKSQQKAAASVRICEECFVRAQRSGLFGQPSPQAKAFLRAMLENTADTYNALLKEDAEPVSNFNPANYSPALFVEQI